MSETIELSIKFRGDLAQLEQQLDAWAAQKTVKVGVAVGGVSGGGGGGSAPAGGGGGGGTAASVARSSAAPANGRNVGQSSGPRPSYPVATNNGAGVIPGMTARHSYLQYPNNADRPFQSDYMTGPAERSAMIMSQVSDKGQRAFGNALMNAYMASPGLRMIQNTMPGLWGLMSGKPGAFVRSFGEGAMMTLGSAAQSYFQYAQQGQLTGRHDAMQLANAQGSLVGGMIGGGIGALFGGIGGPIGAMAGGNIGAAAFEFFEANGARHTRNLVASLGVGMSTSAMDGNRLKMYPGSIGLGPSGRPAALRGAVDNPGVSSAKNLKKWHGQLESDIRNLYDDYFGSKEQLEAATPTREEIGQAHASIFDAFVSSGIDPRGSGMYRRWDGIQMTRVSAKSLSQFDVNISGALDKVEDVSELSRRTTQQIFTRRLVQGNEAAKNVTKVIAGLGKTGTNTADLLMANGPQATFDYLESQTPLGDTVSTNLGTLMKTTGEMNRLGIRLSRSAERVRGRGAEQEGIYRDMIGTLSDLPGGAGSLEVEKLRTGRRRAMFQHESEQDLGYSMRNVDISSAQQKSQYMPYSPGYGMKLSLQGLMNNAGQMKVMRDRYNKHMKDGDYSEAEQLAAYSQIKSMEVAQAQGVAVLSEGGENRMMAMSAGRPNFFARQDSAQLAAMSVIHRGMPTKAYGSVSRSQRNFQNDFIKSFVSDSFDAGSAMSPNSTTSAMNNSLSVDGLSKSMDRLAHAFEKFAGGTGAEGTRPGEARGKAKARQDASSADPRNLYH